MGSPSKNLNLCGREVIRLRGLRGWSQETLASKCQLKGWDISRDIIASIELRRRRVDDFELVRLAGVFRVALEELVPRGQRPRRP